jgi:lipopolysaccharide export system permease protein
MRKLQVYALKEFIPPFLLSICVFTFVMLLDRLLDLLDMIVTKGVPLRTVGEILLLILPSMIAVVVPMAVLSGVLMAFGRLSGDLEITAMKASGVGILTPMLPVLAFSAILAGVLVSFNNRILPNANHMARNLILDVGMLRPTARIIPGMFVEDLEGLRILVGSKDDITGELRDVVIQQKLPGRPERTITATSGIMEPMGGGMMRLVLRSGQMQELAGDSVCRTLDFMIYTLDVASSDELTRHERESRGDREMSTSEMRSLIDSSTAAVSVLRDSMRTLGRAPLIAVLQGRPVFTVDSSSTDAAANPRTRFAFSRNALARTAAELRILRDRIESTGRSISKYRVEIEKKFSIPFACMIFVLLGVPLGISTRQGGAGVALALSLVFILVYYVMLIGGEQLADRGIVTPVAAMWAPNVLMGALGVYLTIRSIREGTPVRLPDLKPLLQRFQRDSS